MKKRNLYKKLVAKTKSIYKARRIADKLYVKGLIKYEIKNTPSALKLIFSEDEQAYKEKEKSFGKISYLLMT